MSGMTRGELAKRTGLSMATILYYEESGILPPPSRFANGYRVYTDDYLVKIKFIKDAKSLGYSLKEIGQILQMLQKDMDKEALKEVVSGKIVEIEERINSLRALQAQLAGWLNTPDEDIQNYLRIFRSK
ncbi:MerR family transcriptional regulator [Paenibacillus lentus]|uniref:MerR family transcriptional regulator n=1 Tax=Paenibacillus lentus TaxID=1338368 RepID=UPI0036D43D9D